MSEFVVLGGSGHGKVLISILNKLGHNVLGYLDPHDRGIVLGKQRLGDDALLPELLNKHPGCQAAIGIGKVDTTSDVRERILEHLEILGFGLPPIVSPQAIVNENVALGTGSVVFDGVVVNSGTEIGRGCILNTNCTVEHDCQIGDHVHVASGATLSGKISVGDNCLLGSGVNIIQSVYICADCLIGAGATVIKDIKNPGVYAGTPATRIR
jgi:UDP-perosamine 4-acetyltransferase